MPIKGPVLLYGAGAEAKSTCAFLAQTQPELTVFVTADSGTPEIEDAAVLPPEDLPEAIAARRFATIVKSPGVSRYKPIFAAAREAGITVTSNLNLWGETYRSGRSVIVITGTKGKSTTATLCHAMLTASGIDAGLAGNVGLPPLDAADKNQTIVFELSSYQTADIAFAADTIGITTLYPEHIDWHGSRDRYFADKLNVLARSPGAGLAFGPQASTHELARPWLSAPHRQVPALDPALEESLRDIAPATRLRGAHNVDNAILAARLAIANGATPDGILRALRDFAPLRHRLEDHRIGDKLFVDDSISTTPEATEAAIAAFPQNRLALIVGGYDRQQDYTHLAEAIIAAPVTVVACLPDTGNRLISALAGLGAPLPVFEAPDLATAMRELKAREAEFDALILSPGAPSYNQFANFAERGDAFIALAQELFG